MMALKAQHSVQYQRNLRAVILVSLLFGLSWICRWMIFEHQLQPFFPLILLTSRSESPLPLIANEQHVLIGIFSYVLESLSAISASQLYGR